MRYIILLIFMMNTLFAAKVVETTWQTGETFSQYLEAHHIPIEVLKSVSKDDQKFLSEIDANYHIYELKDDKDTLLQALIPISEVMQIHLTKVKGSQKYTFDIIPIEFEKNEYFGSVTVESKPYTDVLKNTHSKQVAQRLQNALRVIDDKNIHKGDKIDFTYTQRLRAGKPYLKPDIKIIRLMTRGKEKFIYVDEEGDGFTQTDKSVAYAVTGKRKVTYSKRVPISKAEAMFGMPLRHVRVTSNFSYSRWHPILHLYRPHHGTDFGARRGTPLLAVNVGVITYAGDMGTYGKVVKIRHNDGYVSLYAHQSSIRVKMGEHVQKGDVIGYVGSTGRSTGPHLHFGLMKNGRWIDPMTVLRKKYIHLTVLKKFIKYQDVTTSKYKTVAIKNVKKNKAKLLDYVHNNEPCYVWEE